MIICDDLIKYILEYNLIDNNLIIQALKKNNLRLIKLFLNDHSRIIFWEYISKYPNNYVLKKLDIPRSYNEMFHQLKGKIRANDWEFLENFSDYRSVLLNDLIMFCIEFKSLSGFIYFLKKLDETRPIFFDKKILKYACQAQKYKCDEIIEYVRFRYNNLLDANFNISYPFSI